MDDLDPIKDWLDASSTNWPDATFPSSAPVHEDHITHEPLPLAAEFPGNDEGCMGWDFALGPEFDLLQNPIERGSHALEQEVEQ